MVLDGSAITVAVEYEQNTSIETLVTNQVEGTPLTEVTDQYDFPDGTATLYQRIVESVERV